MQIHSETLLFLKKLTKNNNREWFEKNRPAYLSAKENVEQVLQQIIDLLSKSEPSLKGLVAKNTLFRIHRDVRFSADKSPFKTHFGAILHPNGKKGGGVGYYLHLEPMGKSMAGAGVWMPEPAALQAIRQEIDYNLPAFEAILENKQFKKTFGELADYRLKTKPKGYEADNPALPYLKQKSFVVFHAWNDDEIISPHFVKDCVRIFETAAPLQHFLNRAMTES